MNRLAFVLILSFFAMLGGVSCDQSSIPFGKYLGCHEDRAKRDLDGSIEKSDSMTIEKCIRRCFNKSFHYAGLQASAYCLCGNSHSPEYKIVDDSECGWKCTGNTLQECGGNSRNSLYKVSVVYTTYLGCYIDEKARDLNKPPPVLEDSLTKEKCFHKCFKKGLPYAGLQGHTYCSCGESFGRYGGVTESQCRYACTGNSRQWCGGNMKNSIYKISEDMCYFNPCKHNGRCINEKDSFICKFCNGFVEIHYDLNAHATYLGCYEDCQPRDLSGVIVSFPSMTVKKCIRFCKYKGYTHAGLQAMSFCLCGNSTGLKGKVDKSQCNLKCSGNDKQICGGYMKNSVYKIPDDPCFPDPCSKDGKCIKENDSFKCKYNNGFIETGYKLNVHTEYLGCYEDKSNPRSLNGFSLSDLSMTIERCTSFCFYKKYRFAGVQAHTYCFCGNSHSTTYRKIDDFFCNMNCAGNTTQMCGGNMKNSLYKVSEDKCVSHSCKSYEICVNKDDSYICKCRNDFNATGNGLDCNEGLVINKKCIKLAYRIGPSTNYAEAIQACEKIGASLAEITDDCMYNIVYDYVSHFWIKFSDKPILNDVPIVRVWLGSTFKVENNPDNLITLTNGKTITSKRWLYGSAHMSKDKTRLTMLVYLYNEPRNGLQNVSPTKNNMAPLCSFDLE